METETKATHTPGPWAIHEPILPGELAVIETVQYQFTIAGVDPYYFDFNGPQPVEAEWHPDVVKANARLIAAAPDLLEALKALVSQIESGALMTRPELVQSAKDSLFDAGVKASRAIAKATGVQS